MRYSTNEKANLVGIFNKTGLTVTIELLELSNDNLVELTTNACIESAHMPGIYLFSTENIKADSLVGYSNILYKMTDTSDTTNVYYGKIVFGGVLDDTTAIDITTITDSIDELSLRMELLLAEQA